MKSLLLFMFIVIIGIGIYFFLKVRKSPTSIQTFKNTKLIPKILNNLHIVVSPQNHSSTEIESFLRLLLQQSVPIRKIILVLSQEDHKHIYLSPEITQRIQVQKIKADYNCSIRGMIQTLLQETDDTIYFLHMNQMSSSMSPTVIESLLQNIDNEHTFIQFKDDTYFYTSSMFDYTKSVCQMNPANLKNFLADNITTKIVN